MVIFTAKMKTSPWKVLKRSRAILKGKGPVETTQPKAPSHQLGKGRLWKPRQAGTVLHLSSRTDRLRLRRTSRNSHLSPRRGLLAADLSFISYCCLMAPLRVQLNKAFSNIWSTEKQLWKGDSSVGLATRRLGETELDDLLRTWLINRNIEGLSVLFHSMWSSVTVEIVCLLIHSAQAEYKLQESLRENKRHM